MPEGIRGYLCVCLFPVRREKSRRSKPDVSFGIKDTGKNSQVRTFSGVLLAAPRGCRAPIFKKER